MKRIYTAANLPEAYIVRDLLRGAGVAAHVFNEHANGAMGEIPMGSTYPQVWIAQLHQEQHARAVIARYEHAPVAAARACAVCGEVNPGQFEICWSCGAMFTLEA